MWLFTSLWLFSRLCLCLLKLTITCLTVALFEFILLEVHWASWCLYSCLPSNLGDQSLFLQISLCPFLSPTSPLDLLAFLQPVFFQFLRLSNFYCLSSNLLILPSTCSDLPLNPSGEIFISVIELSSPEFL